MGTIGNDSLFHWKVGHPTAPNNIVQMASFGQQAPFCAGGNQSAYYLGKRGNSMMTQPEPKQLFSRSQTLQLDAMESIGHNVKMSIPALVLGSHHM